MPKIIDRDVREIVLNVRKHFLKEKEQVDPIRYTKVNDRLAAATGLPLRTLSRIAHKPSIPEKLVIKKKKKNEKIKRKTMTDKVKLANAYLDETNSGHMEPELTDEFWEKAKETDPVSDPLIPEDQGFVAIHYIDESSSEENSRLATTKVIIENTEM